MHTHEYSSTALQWSRVKDFKLAALEHFLHSRNPSLHWLVMQGLLKIYEFSKVVEDRGKQSEGIIRIEEALSLSDSCVWRRATISKLPNYQITPPTTQHLPRGCAPCVSLDGALGERVRGEELVWKGGGGRGGLSKQGQGKFSGF